MSGAETDTNTVREGFSAHVMVWKDTSDYIRTAVDDPDCNVCAAEAALSRLSGRVTELEQENALLRPPAGAAPILLIDAQQLESRVTELEQALRQCAEAIDFAAGGICPEDRCPHEDCKAVRRARAAFAGSAGQEQA